MNILHFDSETAWVTGVVSLWRDRLRTNPRLRICLASGSTPIKIYSGMAPLVKAELVSFRDAEIFALDDYGGLAPDDQGKCANMLRRYLVDHIDLPQERFHAIDVDSPDLEKVCREYDRLIDDGFDLALLGIGLNGHLGLNEPGSSPDSVTRRVEMHASTVSASANYLKHSNLPTWGVGVGLKQLLGSKEVWLLANGAKKAEIVHRTVKGEISIDLPASLLRRHPNAWVIVDAEAGALL
jgi:glucosamine-6-phosphate isomerase